jgi:hypothetical protein
MLKVRETLRCLPPVCLIALAYVPLIMSHHNIVQSAFEMLVKAVTAQSIVPADGETDLLRARPHHRSHGGRCPHVTLGILSAQSNSASDCPTQLPLSKASSEAPPTGCRHLHPSNSRSHDAVTSRAPGAEGWHGRRRRPVRSHHAPQLFSRPGPPPLRHQLHRPLHQVLTGTCVYRPVALTASNAAGYATLREIEGRLKSIRNIEKITKTMKVVASTKLTRAQKAMRESRQYGQTSNTVFESAETKSIESDKKSLIVVCSSDKGLCGGIHSGMSRKVRKMLLDAPDTDLAVIGEKCKAQLGRSNGRNMVLSFAGAGKNVPTFADSLHIADQLSMLPADYSSVKIVYNKFVNAGSYEATIQEAFSEEAISQSGRSCV